MNSFSTQIYLFNNKKAKTIIIVSSIKFLIYLFFTVISQIKTAD